MVCTLTLLELQHVAAMPHTCTASLPHLDRKPAPSVCVQMGMRRWVQHAEMWAGQRQSDAKYFHLTCASPLVDKEMGIFFLTVWALQ